jgi:hypothetical protein
MNTRNEKGAIHEALMDHHRLLDVQARLARRFAEAVPCGFDTWILKVRSEIEEMATLLDGHFEREEQDRLHDEIAEKVPNAAPRLSALLKEHRLILTRAQDLLSQSISCESPMEGASLCVEASDFFAALDQHERAERELFLLAIEGEDGAPD